MKNYFQLLCFYFLFLFSVIAFLFCDIVFLFSVAVLLIGPVTFLRLSSPLNYKHMTTTPSYGCRNERSSAGSPKPSKFPLSSSLCQVPSVKFPLSSSLCQVPSVKFPLSSSLCQDGSRTAEFTARLAHFKEFVIPPPPFFMIDSLLYTAPYHPLPCSFIFTHQ